jgi:hypothetical protein
MNWDAIGAVGEIAGAAGVIITLIYLSLQIRQNTRASRITAVQTAAESSAKFTELLATDGELCDIFWQGLADPDELSGAEFRRFASIINAFLRREAVNYRLFLEGHLPPEDWEARQRNLAILLVRPGVHRYLEMAPDAIPPDFYNLLRRLMSEPSSPSNEHVERMFRFDNN